MKPAIQILGVIALALALGACSKKSSKSSTVATTPNTQCTYNGYSGYVYPGTNTPCTPTTGTGSGTCVQSTNGQYLNQYGQTCYPGQTGGTQFPGGGDGCSQYYYQYGVQYVPVNMNGQLMCMRYDLVQQYYGGQYYGQPIYGGNYGGQYGYGGGYGASCINIGGQSWGQNYGLNGQIGLCF